MAGIHRPVSIDYKEAFKASKFILTVPVRFKGKWRFPLACMLFRLAVSVLGSKEGVTVDTSPDEADKPDGVELEATATRPPLLFRSPRMLTRENREALKESLALAANDPGKFMILEPGLEAWTVVNGQWTRLEDIPRNHAQ